MKTTQNGFKVGEGCKPFATQRGSGEHNPKPTTRRGLKRRGQGGK